MKSAKGILLTFLVTSILCACSGGGGSSGAGASDPSGDVIANEAILSKEPTQMSDFDQSFYTTFKAKFNMNYVDSIVAAYPKVLLEDYISNDIITKTASCESNTFSGSAITYDGNGYPLSDQNAEYKNCSIGSSSQSGSLVTEAGTYVKQSYNATYADSDPNDATDDAQTFYHIWEVKKSVSGTKTTYTYRSREGVQKHHQYALQYQAHWMTFTIDTSTTPVTITATGKVQMYLKDATDGDVLKSYNMTFGNLEPYTSGGNDCITGYAKLTDGTNTQTGVYMGDAGPINLMGGFNPLICFKTVAL